VSPTYPSGPTAGQNHTGDSGGWPIADGWPARRVFEELRELGALRVISVSGPSIFEAICSLGAFGVADGWLNAMTP